MSLSHLGRLLPVVAAVAAVALPASYAAAGLGGAPEVGATPAPGQQEDLADARRDQEAEEARLDAPQAEAEREQSAHAFAGQGPAEALGTVREEHPELLDPPVWEPVRLREGQRVERFVGEHGARIADVDGRRSVVDSTLPLRSDLGDGPKRLADLSLEDRGATFGPDNPLLRTELPKAADGPVRLGDDGLSVALQTAAEAAGAEVKDRVVYPNALPDTDFVVMPTPTGVELSLQVRSRDAPEEATLDLDLPEGIEARLVEGDADHPPKGGVAGTVQLSKDGEDVATRVQGRDATPGGPDSGGGLGMWLTQFQVPSTAGIQAVNRYNACDRQRVSRCPRTNDLTLNYSTNDVDPGVDGDQQMPEGVNTIGAIPFDILLKGDGASAGTVKVDRADPTLEVEGTLKPEDRDWVGSGNQTLSIDAADTGSGIASAEIEIDRVRVGDEFTQACPDGKCPSSGTQTSTRTTSTPPRRGTSRSPPALTP